jgi:site-specific DNA recombinase
MKVDTRNFTRCAIYTRKSSEEGLDQTFNSLDAQREACESYIKSQRHEGWHALPQLYDDGGFSGGNTERPALTLLLNNIKAGKVDVIVVYKVDRLSRSLADFVRLVDLFDEHQVSFVSVTQQFNTSSSMGRLTLNVLLSFAQFEREVTSERIRDKIAASKQKGMWMGGVVPLGYDVIDKTLVVNEAETQRIRHIYTRYVALGCVRKLKEELDAEGYVSKARELKGVHAGGKPFSRGALYALLKNPLYIGKVTHQGTHYEGQHAAILDSVLWQTAQNLLTENKNQHETKTAVKNPSLLAGLLFDDNGNPMSPTHTKKHNRRYRYYINQAVLQYREKEAGTVLRIPANTIEDVIISRLKQLWQSPNALLNTLEDFELTITQQSTIIKQAKLLTETWDDNTPHEHINILRKCVKSIQISCDGVELTLSKMGLLDCLLKGISQHKELKMTLHDDYRLIIPARLKRCGIESKLIVNDRDDDVPHQRTIMALQSALQKGLTWHNELINGRVSSMVEIAKQEGVTRPYVARHIKLAFLAPDIIETILKGKIPITLSLDKLREGFPMNWQTQRKMLGFSS